MQQLSLPWDLVAILLVLGILVPWRGAVRVQSLLARAQLSSEERLATYGITIAFQWLAAVVTAWRALAHGWTPATLGLSPRDPTAGLLLGAAMAVVLGFIQVAGLRQLSRIPPQQRGRLYQIAARLMPQDLTETLLFVALVCTVSLCEEFLYRGFAFAAFMQLGGGSVLVAIGGSSVLFAAGHLYQGWRGMTNTLVLGLLLGGARFWSDSLIPPIIAHLAVDLVAGLAGARAARKGQSDQQQDNGD
jgi:membrane protease YdiL (CAAX protease family)